MFSGGSGEPSAQSARASLFQGRRFAAFLHIGEPFFLLRWFMIPILTLLSATYEHARMNCCFRRVCYFFIGIIFQIFFLFSDALCPEVFFRRYFGAKHRGICNSGGFVVRAVLIMAAKEFFDAKAKAFCNRALRG